MPRYLPKVFVAALFAAFVFSGWTVPASANPKTYLTPEGAERMMAAKGVEAQWDTAREICIENGLAADTAQFKRCVAEYQIFRLLALRKKAKGLTEGVARRHGLCIDRHRFEFSRCTEI